MPPRDRLRPNPLATAILGGLLSPGLLAADAESTVAVAAAASAPQQVEITADAGAYAPRDSNAATGLDLSRRETPQSISVISRQQIEDFNLDSINRVLAITPGVTVESVETDRTYFTSRGFDVTNFQFDGIGIPFTNGSQWGDLDTALFQRIDVLRGANGLLSSTGNPSATIDFVRKRPTATWQGEGALTLGSWNAQRVEGDLSGPLTTDGSVRGRVIAVGDRTDSYLDRYSRIRTVASGLVDVDLGRETVLSLGFVAQRNDARSPMWGALPLTYSDGTPTHYRIGTSTAADWAYWNNDDHRLFAELTHDFGSQWSMKATFSARNLAADSALFYVYGLPDKTTGTGLFAYPSLFDGQYGQRVADLRVDGTFELGGRRHEIMFGADAARETAREHSLYGEGIGDPVPDLATWNGSVPEPRFDAGADGSDFDTHRTSLFAATHLHASDTLAFVLGANATRLRARGQNYGVPHDTNERALTPYAGVVRDLGRGLAAYASYTRIFSPQVETDIDHRVLSPTRGTNAELGLKGEWLDRRLAGSVALFRTRQAGTAAAAGVYPAGDPQAGQSYYVGEDDTSKGIEFEVSGRIAPGWDVNGGYTQLDLEHDADGSQARTFIPRRMLRLATTWTPRGEPRLKLGAALKWQSAVYVVDPSDGFVARQAAYALVDLMASWEATPRWTVDLNVDNVANQRYVASLYWTQGFYGEPLKATVSARYAF